MHQEENRIDWIVEWAFKHARNASVHFVVALQWCDVQQGFVIQFVVCCTEDQKKLLGYRGFGNYFHFLRIEDLIALIKTNCNFLMQ